MKFVTVLELNGNIQQNEFSVINPDSLDDFINELLKNSADLLCWSRVDDDQSEWLR